MPPRLDQPRNKIASFDFHYRVTAEIPEKGLAQFPLRPKTERTARVIELTPSFARSTAGRARVVTDNPP